MGPSSRAIRPVGTSLRSIARTSGTQKKLLTILLAMFFVCAATEPGDAQGLSLQAPAVPSVAPIISGDYPGDLDGNRINDELESGAAARTGISVAGGEDSGLAAVELIFSEPVTQQQIDDFLSLGGRIAYIFQAVSFGWTGQIPRNYLSLLPAIMGPSLVRVEPIRHVTPYMDLSSRTGRVRPVWAPGFAGNVAGFQGSPNTTIAFIDTGVDGTHKDLIGRCVYWRDFTTEGESEAVDYYGHGTAVAGVALGTGAAGGTGGNAGLRYTYVSPGSPDVHLANPISLPPVFTDVRSTAWWSGPMAALFHVRWEKGTAGNDFDWTGSAGANLGDSPVYLDAVIKGFDNLVFSTALFDPWEPTQLDDVVFYTFVDHYPAIGDGFAKFSGVAPGCKWAAAKVVRKNGELDETNGDPFAAALDDCVANRVGRKIKVINLSFGYLSDDGLPQENVATRDKVNTAVNNGIIVVTAAGNNGGAKTDTEKKMADPARAALAITVGATNDENALTSYSATGFVAPSSNEDYKPDMLAPGGSIRYTGILTPDSSSSDGAGKDHVADDYTCEIGTSFSAPFVAGCAALVIEALERQGVAWDFSSSALPRYVKMLLCATASETNAPPEGAISSLTLQRGGKDLSEGYGIINADAAVEGISQALATGIDASDSLGSANTDKRVWARTIELTGGRPIVVSLDNPAGGDFDMYLYSLVPSAAGTPVVLASGTLAGAGVDEVLRYSSATDTKALLAVKRVSGAGTFTVHTELGGPPVAQDSDTTTGVNTPVTVTLAAKDDGSPIPPGAMTYTIASLPAHGRLETTAGAAISQVPTALPGSSNQVVYRPDAGWGGQDSFTFYATDGGTPPYAGQSNTATARITVLSELTVEYRVSAGGDDASGLQYSSYQELTAASLAIGGYMDGLRFRNVQIPPGATIKSATLSICAYTYGLTGQITAKLQAEAADNPNDFTARRVSGVVPTAASQAWNWDSAEWTAGTWYQSPDIRNLIQDVVNRPGWTMGNALVLIYSSSSYESDRRFWSYDGDPTKAARLKITYAPK